MQSEILTFEKNGKINKLFGNYNNLTPQYISGIAHAFRDEKTWILTLYSETGLVNGNEVVCSADSRIAINETNIRHLISELSNLIDVNKKEVEKTNNLNDDTNKIKETLGPILP
tara:strand:+ start:172 stop:513 length:342 start_codon:yes stop_codon:yes gene_type:complete